MDVRTFGQNYGVATPFSTCYLTVSGIVMLETCLNERIKKVYFVQNGHTDFLVNAEGIILAIFEIDRTIQTCLDSKSFPLRTDVR